MALNSVFVIPGFTFFYWGFTLPKRENREFVKHFKLNKGPLVRPIQLQVNGKYYSAKIRKVRIRTKNFPKRDVIQIFYENEFDTLKALRKLFIYSYASTINKKKPNLKELLELQHLGGARFGVRPISKQRTDFDNMFYFLEEKNLFEYWKDSKSGRSKNFFVDFSRRWLSVDLLPSYRSRQNVIYLLYHSKMKQLYVGKANKFGARVTKGCRRQGLDKNWDKFMFFEIDPEFRAFISQIESFIIRSFASLLENDTGMQALKTSNVKLVNRQLLRR